jgi:DNA-binding CsgD family transcriptional regulator
MFDVSRASEALDPPSPEGLVLQWLAIDEATRVIVDEDLRIVWANAAAIQSFEGDTDLNIRDGFLSTYHRAQQQALIGFVRGASAGLSTLCVLTQDKDSHYLFRVREIGSESERRFFGLSFHRSGRRFRAIYADLGAAFKLTSGEERVLLQMLEGLTATEIAAKLTLSLETVRSHIRNLYTKIGVSSRERLFSELRAYRI